MDEHGTETPTPDDGLEQLLDVAREATSAFIGGDMRRYYALTEHTDDYTLMAPTGGDVTRPGEVSDAEIAAMARFFRRGDATLEVVETYTSGDLAVLVAVERQHGDVGDFPTQDWSLRVTLVFRHEDGRWRLAHRHADALVHPIPFAELARLARGLDPPEEAPGTVG